MKEADVCAALTKALRAALPGSDVWKVHDVSTKGRPDIVVTWRGFTTWLEVKLLRKGDSVEGCAKESPLQHRTMIQLQKQTYGRAWYVIYDLRDPKDKATFLFQPTDVLAGQLYATHVGHGFNHALVAELIEQTHSEDHREAA